MEAPRPPRRADVATFVFPTTLDDLPNKWYKIEEARGDTFTWQTLREDFIKDLSFIPYDENWKPTARKIQQFLGTNLSDKIVEDNPTKECRQVLVEELQHSTQLQLEAGHFSGRRFHLKINYPLGKTKVKTLYKISIEQKPIQENTKEEKLGEPDFPPQYSEIKEGKQELNESKAPKWMDAKIKIKEVNIAKDGQPKMARIGDYWSEQQTIEIVDLLKEYQDVFARDYKDLKGLVKEMGKMKTDLLPDPTLVKKRPYKLAHKYKEIVKTEIDNMLTTWIIYHVDQSEWASPMVVQPKKHDPKKLRVCVDYR